MMDEKTRLQLHEQYKPYVQPSWTKKSLDRQSVPPDCPYRLATPTAGDQDFAGDRFNVFLKTQAAVDLLDELLGAAPEDVKARSAEFAARFDALDPWDAVEVWHNVNVLSCGPRQQHRFELIKVVHNIVVERVLEHIGASK